MRPPIYFDRGVRSWPSQYVVACIMKTLSPLMQSCRHTFQPQDGHAPCRMGHILLLHPSPHCGLPSTCYCGSTLPPPPPPPPQSFSCPYCPSGFLVSRHFHNNYNVKTGDSHFIIVFVTETLALTYNASLR